MHFIIISSKPLRDIEIVIKQTTFREKHTSFIGTTITLCQTIIQLAKHFLFHKQQTTYFYRQGLCIILCESVI